MDLSTRVMTLLRQHPSVQDVVLSGSRQRDEATSLSDWDFEVEVDDLDRFVDDLPTLVHELSPLGQQWDRLSSRWNYMLLLPGPTKVDIIVNRPHIQEGPWKPSRENLRHLDHHFWDWILWLAGKALRGQEDLVKAELAKMSDHLLRPLGVAPVPGDVQAAVRAYCRVRSEAEARFDTAVERRIETEVRRALAEAGLDV